MEITSSAFRHGEEIPKKFTCDDIDVSPSLSWSGAPEETRSFALICDDPDAPVGVWVHWVIYNIPAGTNNLQEAVPTTEILVSGARQGENDFGRIGYGGPCPPPGHGYHRYFFKLYALNTVLDLKDRKVTKKVLLEAMKGHVLAEAQLMGKYKRNRVHFGP